MLRFALTALACVAVCEMTGSVRLIGPFIASISVVCSAVSAAPRAQAGHAAIVSYAVCVPLGLLAHAAPGAGPWVAVAAACVGFGLLRVLKQPHAPALALVAVLALVGASATDLVAVVAMVAAVWAGGRIGSREPACAQAHRKPPISS